MQWDGCPHAGLPQFLPELYQDQRCAKGPSHDSVSCVFIEGHTALQPMGTVFEVCHTGRGGVGGRVEPASGLQAGELAQDLGSYGQTVHMSCSSVGCLPSS